MPSTPRFFAVIGPPRCGASALLRALPALGVGLGDALRSAPPGASSAASVEDPEIAALNTRLYRALDCEWHRLDAISANDIAALRGTELHAEAVRLVARKIESCGQEGRRDFGFTSPQMTRLLPFWTGVFAELDLPCHYLLALRHPASMAASLLKRTGFAEAKCHFLWIEYVTAAIAGTRGQALAVVSCEGLCDEPAASLRRVATQFDLPFDPLGEPFTAYRDDFLGPRLRHADASAIGAASQADALALYDALLPLSIGDAAASGSWRDVVEAVHQRHRDAQAVIAAARDEEMRALDLIRSELGASRVLLELDMAHGTAEAPARADLLERAVLERDHLLERASRGLSERTLEIVALRETLAERTATLHQREADLREHIRALGQTSRGLTERTGELVTTRALLVERTTALQVASEALIDRTARLEAALAKGGNREGG
jgi:hypothetical protein